jgi:hypothetical protein
MYLSLRTRDRAGHAGRSIARIVGKEGKAGGHGMMAGGIARLERFDPPTYETALRAVAQRFLEVVEATGREPVPLLEPNGATGDALLSEELSGKA